MSRIGYPTNRGLSDSRYVLKTGDTMTGNLVVDGSIETGAFLGVGDAPSTTNIIRYDETFTGTDAYTGLSGIVRLNSASANSQTSFGVNVQVQTVGGNAQNYSGGLRGLKGFTEHNGTGTVNSAYGLEFQNRNTSTGVITEAIAIHVLATDNTGGGTIGTSYGIKILDQNVGSNNFAIHTQSGHAKFNAGNTASDFQVSSDNNNDMLFVRGGSDTVGVRYWNPDAVFGVKGKGTTTGRIIEFIDSNEADKFFVLDSGNATLAGTLTINGLRINQTPTSESITPTHTVTVNLNGTDYKIAVQAA